MTASAAVVRSPTGLVTVSDVTVAVDQNSAHAFVGRIRVGGRDLGSVAATCRDGVATASRTGTTFLARNIAITFGTTAPGGDTARAVGATIVITGAGDRVVHAVSVAGVSCARTAGAPS
jgi:hypothetical protein